MTQDLTTEEHLKKVLTDACDGRIVQMPAPMSLPVHYPGGSPNFKTIKFKGNEEFTLADVRLGRTGWIFRAAPIDSADYAHIEIGAKVIKTFPPLEAHIVDSLAGYLHRLQTEAVETDLDAPFIPSGAPFLSAISTFTRAVEPLREKLRLARVAAAEREAAATYADNPLWGSW